MMQCDVFARTFNSRPHTEVDYSLLEKESLQLSFNSRPHTEVDGGRVSRISNCNSFNSRPHTEVDRNYSNHELFCYLSTHDLTRRSTSLEELKADADPLSTHDLTRRSTICMHNLLYYIVSFNSRPHTEVDPPSPPSANS